MPRKTHLTRDGVAYAFLVVSDEDVRDRRLAGPFGIQAVPAGGSIGEMAEYGFTLVGFPTQSEALAAALNEVARRKRLAWQWPR